MGRGPGEASTRLGAGSSGSLRRATQAGGRPRLRGYRRSGSGLGDCGEGRWGRCPLFPPAPGLPCEGGRASSRKWGGADPLCPQGGLCPCREDPMQDARGTRPGSPGGAGDTWGPSLGQGEIVFGGSGKKRGKVRAAPPGDWPAPTPGLPGPRAPTPISRLLSLKGSVWSPQEDRILELIAPSGPCLPPQHTAGQAPPLAILGSQVAQRVQMAWGALASNCDPAPPSGAQPTPVPSAPSPAPLIPPCSS